MVAKAGLGLIGIGAISVGGVALAKPGWLGMGNSMPECHTLASDSDFNSGGYTNQFGGKHKYYLVGVSNKEGNKNNQNWWEWSFERLKKDGIKTGKFAVVGTTAEDTSNIKVTQKYDGRTTDANTKALNQVCKAAYKVGTDKITTSGSGTDDYKEEDVWKYCSFLGEKPKTISENSETGNYTGSNAIGADASESKKLVSTKGNDKFWEIRDKEFKGSPGYDKIETSVDEFFKPREGKTIKDLCEEAYNKSKDTNNSSATAPAKEKTVKYCSLSKE